LITATPFINRKDDIIGLAGLPCKDDFYESLSAEEKASVGADNFDIFSQRFEEEHSSVLGQRNI